MGKRGRGVGGSCEGGGGRREWGEGLYILLAWLLMRSSKLKESISF